MKWLRRLYFRIIPHYRVVDRMEFNVQRAMEMIYRNDFVPASQRWYPINGRWGVFIQPTSMVTMERFERIWE